MILQGGEGKKQPSIQLEEICIFFCHLHIRVLLIPISLLRSHPVGPFFLTFVVASACSSPHRIESFSFSYLLFFAQRRDVTPAIISPFFFVSTSSFSTTTTTTTNLWEQFNLLLKPPLRFTWTSFVPSDFFSNFRWAIFFFFFFRKTTTNNILRVTHSVIYVVHVMLDLPHHIHSQHFYFPPFPFFRFRRRKKKNLTGAVLRTRPEALPSPISWHLLRWPPSFRKDLVSSSSCFSTGATRFITQVFSFPKFGFWAHQSANSNCSLTFLYCHGG